MKTRRGEKVDYRISSFIHPSPSHSVWHSAFPHGSHAGRFEMDRSFRGLSKKADERHGPQAKELRDEQAMENPLGNTGILTCQIMSQQVTEQLAASESAFSRQAQMCRTYDPKTQLVINFETNTPSDEFICFRALFEPGGRGQDHR